MSPVGLILFRLRHPPDDVVRRSGFGSVALLLALELVAIVNQRVEHGVNRIRLVVRRTSRPCR